MQVQQMGGQRMPSSHLETLGTPTGFSGGYSTVSSPYPLIHQPSLSSMGSVHHPVLDDSQFAPPPKPPQSLEATNEMLLSERREMGSTASLPAFNEIKHSGEVNARFSLKSLLINKKWRPTFWIMFGSNQLLFFRNKTDFDEWVSNPFLQKPDRDKLVKLSIDVVNDLNKPGLKMRGYKATPIRSKHTREGALNAFKLERWFSYGPAVVAAFGGKNASQVGALHSIMTEMIQKSGKDFAMEVQPGFSYPDSDVESGHNSNARDIRSTPSNLSFSTMSLDSKGRDRQDQLYDVKENYGGMQRQTSSSRSKIFSTFRSNVSSRSRGNDSTSSSFKSEEGPKFRLSVPRSFSLRKPPRAPPERPSERSPDHYL